jgi:soluble lytic murein transglycosylase-like protein
MGIPIKETNRNFCLFIVFMAVVVMSLLIGKADAFCFQEAGETYGVSPLLLEAIMVVESQGDPGAVNYNTDGSYDFGLMQINSSWAKPWGLKVWSTLGDPCVNMYAGAYVLAGCIKQCGKTWEAVGCYNARTKQKKIDYVRKVKAVFERLQVEKEDKKGGEGCLAGNSEDSQRNRSGLQ